MNERDKTIAVINKIALTLIDRKTYTRDSYDRCFTLANDYNREHEESEICVCELEDGIMIEDETFYFED